MDISYTEIATLIDFEMLINVDYGIIRLMQQKFNNTEYVDRNYLTKAKDYAILIQLLDRTEENPIEMVMAEDYKDQAASLLTQIKNQYYNEILDLATNTVLMPMFNALIKTDQMTVTVRCNNIIEEHFIKRKLPGVITIISDVKEATSNNKYDFFYLKKYSDVLNIKGCLIKNLYIGNYAFNMEPGYDNVLKLSISDLASVRNQLFIIDLYHKLENIEG